MTRMLILLNILVTLLFSPASVAYGGLLFNVSATGTPGNVNFTLCLNGRGPVSCQNYTVSALSLSISTTIPNHVYSNAGIKINTPGFLLTGCTPISNGYCLFTTSNTTPASIGLGITQYELVSVGNPGNAGDITNFGAVSYSFKIGKYPVTIGQYTTFLNAVAATDTYSLYNASLATDLNSAGICQSGSPGHYTYSVMTNSGSSINRPITYVTWFDAARLANWMANGQPHGSQNSKTTENGAYALNGAMGGNAIMKNTINPNTGAPPTYFLPSENEWYKAAYYDPTLGGIGGYYSFATQSNAMPGNVIGNRYNQANYFTVRFSVTQSPDYLSMTQNYLTDVGAFTHSSSFYGTFDQSGNVWEWNDLDGAPTPFRGLRGGHWFGGSVPMESILYSTDTLTRADSGVGFRLAAPA